MNWNNLQEGKCPKCGDNLIPDKTFTNCEACDFKARTNKLIDLSKGKESKQYQKAKAKFDRIKKYNQDKKLKEKTTAETLKKERLYNLGKMLRNGEISQEEYNKKI